MALLSVQGVSKSFAGLQVLADITFDVEEGAIHGLIGPNGAGKTTLFNVISRVLSADSGKMWLDTTIALHRLKPHELTRVGVGRTYQGAAPFVELSVEQNILVGLTFGRAKEKRIHSGSARHREVQRLLDFVGIANLASAAVESCTFVDQKRIELVRALATSPRLLLLDEPMAGMNDTEAGEFVTLLRKICKSGVTIILIEHNMRKVMDASDRITAIVNGTVASEGSPEAVVNEPEIQAAYLGSQEALD